MLLSVALLLSGCALTPWVAAHKLQLEAVTIVAGTVAVTENAISNAFTLGGQVKDLTKKKE